MEEIRKVLYLVPDAICENFEGKVTKWLDARPRPTQAQLDEISDQDIADNDRDIEADNALQSDKVKRLIFELNFDKENRLRVLEGASTVTKTQYKTAIKNLYKSL